MTKAIVTSCKDCKWATWTDKTQVGCAFGLIDKFNEAGIKVLEAYDQEKEFYVINRICVYSRHNSQIIDRDTVEKQIQVKYQVIIHLENHDIELFIQCITSLMSQDIIPQHITVIRPYNLDVQPFKYTKILATTNIPWRFQETVEPNLTSGDLTDLAIDINIFPYYLVLNKPLNVPLNFSTELNDLVNVKFTVFSHLKGNNVELIPSIYHKQLGGNSFKPIEQKMQEDNILCTKLYYIRDLIPCMSNL